MVRAAGAKEVHVRISCPPTISPCFYGVDTPSRIELIAATHTLEEITKFLDADSVAYLSLEGLMTAVGSQRESYCSSCYTGVYPVPFPRDEASYLQLALKLDKEPVANGSDAMSRSPLTRCSMSRAVPDSAPCVGALRARAAALAQEPAAPQAVSAEQLKAAIDKLGDLDYAIRTAASRTVRRTVRRAGSAGAAAGGRRARGRLRSLSRARPADRLQRSAHQRRDARVAARARTIVCGRWPTAFSSIIPIAR